jgi:hypothetical protein
MQSPFFKECGPDCIVYPAPVSSAGAAGLACILLLEMPAYV